MYPKRYDDFVGPVRDSGTQSNFKDCPACGDTRWKVYVDPVTGKWFCFAHNGGGCVETDMHADIWATNILEQLSGHTRHSERQDWPERELPKWEPLSKRALRYLSSRGINKELAVRLGIVEMVERLRVVVPFFGPTGRIIYWSARAYSLQEEGPKYLGAGGRHPLYVLPGWQRQEELVVVEGVFDAIAVAQHYGGTVAALSGKSLPLYLQPELLGLVSRRIIMLLDSDALDAAMKLQARLAGRIRVDVVPLPPGEDPASLGVSIKEYVR